MAPARPEPASASTALRACPRSARTLLPLRPLPANKNLLSAQLWVGRQGPRPSRCAGWGAGGGGNRGHQEHVLVRLSRHRRPCSSPTGHAGDIQQRNAASLCGNHLAPGEQCRSTREPQHIQGCWGCGGHCELWASMGTSYPFPCLLQQGHHPQVLGHRQD